MVREIDGIVMPEGDITFYSKPIDDWLCAYFEYDRLGFKKVCQMNLCFGNMTKKCGCPQKIMERLNAVTQ